VAWLDVFSSAQRGILFRGDHASALRGRRARGGRALELPVVNGATVRAFNAAYFAAQKLGGRSRLQHWDSFFFPLDAVSRWNVSTGGAGSCSSSASCPPARRSASSCATRRPRR